MITLLLCATLSLQDPKPADTGWRELDSVIFIVNEDIVTLSKYRRLMAEQLKDNPTASKAEEMKAQAKVVDDLKRSFTTSQAGQNMGIDKATIDRYTRELERRNIEAKGGVDQFAEFLAQRNLTIEEVRKEWRESAYSQIWVESTTGRSAGVKARISCDRFVRPGYIELEYDQLVERPRQIDIVGGTPSKVQLEILEVDASRVGGTTQAEAAAKSIRARLVAGGDFETEVHNFGTPATKTVMGEPLDEAALGDVDPALSKLVAAASPDEVLPLLPPSKQSAYWRVVVLKKRIAAQIPAFHSRELQDRIELMIQYRNDQARLERARNEQLQGSYVYIRPNGS